MGGPGLPDGLTGAVREALHTVAADSRVIVAVSGGADSVALLQLVVAARPDLTSIVGHVRHGLRDDLADSAAARARAEALGLSFIERIADLGAGAGPEDIARRGRYEAMAAIAELGGTDVVLLGHTADDQAETLLLRIARGTGPDGLAGMAPESRRGGLRLLRPLLRLRRHAVRAVAPAGSWVEDPTNVDPEQRRARARHQVLPALSALRPDQGDPVPALCRLADLARADRQLLDQLAARAVVQRYGPALLVPREGGVVPALRGIQARLLRRAWQQLPGGPPPPPADVLDRVLALPHGRPLQAPGGVLVTASARGWALDPAGGQPPPTRALPVGGEVPLPELGLVLRCTRHQHGSEPVRPPPDERVLLQGPDDPPPIVDIDRAPWAVHLPDAPGPLSVGSREHTGGPDVRDALRTLVPVGLRHLVPVIRDADGRALALGSRALLPIDPTGPALLVTARPSDGGSVASVAVGYPPRP